VKKKIGPVSGHGAKYRIMFLLFGHPGQVTYLHPSRYDVSGGDDGTGGIRRSDVKQGAEKNCEKNALSVYILFAKCIFQAYNICLTHSPSQKDAAGNGGIFFLLKWGKYCLTLRTELVYLRFVISTLIAV
jgi:hypothetical protein